MGRTDLASEILDAAEAALALGITPRQVRRYTAAGVLPAIRRVYGRPIYLRSDVEAFQLRPRGRPKAARPIN